MSKSMADGITYEGSDGSVNLHLDAATRMIICKAYLRGVNDSAEQDWAANCDEAVERVWADIGDMHSTIKEELIGWWICSHCGKGWQKDGAVHPLERHNG